MRYFCFPGASRLFTYAFALLTITLSSLSPARAQVLYGSIVGTVEDQTGAIIQNAAVTIH